jgi:uncharacterized RDD family membrane protein YckC
MASAGPPPLSPDGLWFWDGSGWKSLVSADGTTYWDGKAWVPLAPSLIGKVLQPPSGPPAGTGGNAPGAPSPPSVGPLPPEVEPRPSWLPADAAWPPASLSRAPEQPVTSDVALAPPAPGAVPWANVYSDVIASSTSGRAYAGFWIRFVVYLIDSLILSVPIAVVTVALLGGGAAIQDPTQVQATSRVVNLIYLAISFGYFVFFWTRGATLGMRLFGIRVADQTTFETIGVGKAILRYIGWLVSSFCCAIGFIWAAFDGRKQGWHDKIGGTVVIYR